METAILSLIWQDNYHFFYVGDRNKGYIPFQVWKLFKHSTSFGWVLIELMWYIYLTISYMCHIHQSGFTPSY